MKRQTRIAKRCDKHINEFLKEAEVIPDSEGAYHYSKVSGAKEFYDKNYYLYGEKNKAADLSSAREINFLFLFGKN